MYASAERPVSPDSAAPLPPKPQLPSAARGAAAHPHYHHHQAQHQTYGEASSAASDGPPIERIEALVASRAEAYKLEVEELRVALAKAQRKAQHTADEHAAQLGALNAELEARGRGEALARARCEASEIEHRATRAQLNKLREQTRRTDSTQQHELSTDLFERCADAMRALALHGFRSSVLGWRRRALRGALGGWHAAAVRIAAADAADAARDIVEQASSFARAEAAAGDPASVEAAAREARRAARVARLGNLMEASWRDGVLSAFAAWRLASYAVAAEDDLRDLAGRLRSAQAGMVQVLDGRAASEEQSARLAALMRAVVGVASRKGARAERRARAESLQLAFRPWQMLLMRSRLDAAAAVRDSLDVSRESDAHSSRRAEALTRELQLTRNNLAASQKRAREALADASNAQATAAKAEEQRERSDALAKLARGKAEQEEREKYSAKEAARKERAAVKELRRGMAAVALRATIRRRCELRLSHALAVWGFAAAAIAAEDGGGASVGAAQQRVRAPLLPPPPPPPKPPRRALRGTAAAAAATTTAARLGPTRPTTWSHSTSSWMRRRRASAACNTPRRGARHGGIRTLPRATTTPKRTTASSVGSRWRTSARLLRRRQRPLRRRRGYRVAADRHVVDQCLDHAYRRRVGANVGRSECRFSWRLGLLIECGPSFFVLVLCVFRV